ncbi:MAG TPA: tRNA preQ1(34) S-adenosylmethionine ribosyltransferase-isomerase QueA [Rhodothermales bacterium]|nr:tRNA preQ1(34) S-adenosylmethionine ribosyltransferase-isomerase QueA [Rhodothermales bacterium]
MSLSQNPKSEDQSPKTEDPSPKPEDLTLDAYDFELPEELIAQRPAERRDRSRLLVLDRATGALADRTFADLPDLLAPGDLLVVNDARVIPARLAGAREPGGGRAELFLVERIEEEAEAAVWDVLARPGRRLREGARVRFDGGLVAEVLEVRPDGRRRVRFTAGEGAPVREDVGALMARVGRVPLPHYIRGGEGDDEDRVRYQTVFARAEGSVAAPTAGLHFTPELLAALDARGVERATVTLHVGYGTFEPVKAENLRDHAVAPERIEVPEETAAAIAAARARGGRIVAVGTTTTRALESAAGADGVVRAWAGETGLTVTPGYRFRVVDALVTNFHLPRSSLLVLVASFAGRAATLAAYRYAVAGGYRFYSYGDAMLVA